MPTRREIFSADTNNRHKRLKRNFSWLFSSQFLIGLFGLASLAVAARALGPAALGLLALVETYARTVARLVHFEPWQAAIQYGSQALEADDADRLSHIFYVSMIIDIVGSVAAGVLVLFFAPVIQSQVSAETLPTEAIVLGALAVFISLRATALGVLRLFDKFDVLAKFDVAMAALRLVLYCIGLLLGFGLVGFLVFFAVVSFAESFLIFLIARRELVSRGYGFQHVPFATFNNDNPHFFRFVWNSNLSVIFRQLAQRLDVIILASLVSPTALGFYHVARRASEAALRLGRPLNQAIYPEFTRLAAADRIADIRRLALKVFMGLAVLLLVLLAPILVYLRELLEVLLGAEYSQSAMIVAVQCVAVAVFLSGMIFNPAILSMSRDRTVAILSGVVAGLFFISLFPMVSLFGVVGASYAHLIANSVWLLACLAIVVALPSAQNSEKEVRA